MRALLDKVLSKVISRKLFVFLFACGLKIWGELDSDTWGMIAIVYIGGQTVVDTAKAIRHG